MINESSANQVLDSLITAVVVLNSDLTINQLNTSAEELFGISVEHLAGRKITAIFIDEDEARGFILALEENRHYTKRKARWRLVNHRDITVDFTVTPAPEIERLVIELQPVDRLLKISREEAFLAAQETSRNLVRSMAHEIKNPLGGIRGAAQLLSKELNNIDLEEYTKIIIDETDRLRNLVDRLLGPNNPPKLEEINIHHVLERVIAIIAIEAGDDIQMVRNYDPSIPEFKGDIEQLIQAFLNIVRNAMQALMEHKNQDSARITISTRIQRRYTIGRVNHPLVARVSIRDNGPGIPPEIIEDIFFPMITGRAEGSGLGLSISQKLIGQHKGLIECESRPGQTKFIVYLPLGN